MDLPELFTQSFIVGFTGAMVPGPVFVVNVSETPRHGWKTGPLITLGHGIAEIALVLVLAFGVASLSESTGLLRGIAILGGLGLLAMGTMVIVDTAKNKIRYDVSAKPGKGRGSSLILKGLTSTLTNPYWFAWWATGGLQFVALARPHGALGQMTFFTGHILSDLCWYTTVAVMVWTGRRLFVGAGIRIFLGLCGAFLIYLGGKFLYDGLRGAI